MRFNTILVLTSDENEKKNFCSCAIFSIKFVANIQLSLLFEFQGSTQERSRSCATFARCASLKATH